MKFEPKATSTKYQIGIDAKSFNIIAAWDWGKPTEISSLAEVLENESSACDVDYNGMFGYFVFLTLETENDCPEAWDNIQYIIKEWVENAEKQCKIYNIIVD